MNQLADILTKSFGGFTVSFFSKTIGVIHYCYASLRGVLKLSERLAAPGRNKSQKQSKKKEGNALYIGEEDDDMSNNLSATQINEELVER